jgi:hypothetical protein
VAVSRPWPPSARSHQPPPPCSWAGPASWTSSPPGGARCLPWVTARRRWHCRSTSPTSRS